MMSQSLPDLLAASRAQDLSSRLRGQLEAAGSELTTGQAADIVARTGGDLAPVFAIDAALARLEIGQRDLGLAAARASAAQRALALVEETGGSFGLGLLGAIDRGDAVSSGAYLAEARSALETVIGALDARFGGRALFAGAAEDRTALADADTLIAAVQAAVAGAPDPATAQAALDTFFDAPGGGFETLIYGGSASDAAGVALADGQRETYLPRADAEALRATLKSLAAVVTVDATGFAATAMLRQDYLSEAATGLIAARDEVTGLRAALGTSEGRIAEAAVAVASERSALAIARKDLAGVDQFDAAARFADLEGQLDSLYLVTSRLSRLSLTNYLR